MERVRRPEQLSVFRACVFSVVTFACKTWALRKVDEQQDNHCFRDLTLAKNPLGEARQQKECRQVLFGY